MVDWFKVMQNESDRRIKLEVYAENLAKAIDASDDLSIKINLDLLKEVIAEPFDKYEGAE